MLVALGKDPAYVMAQTGNTNPTVTLGLYAKVMQASDDDRERLRQLIGAEESVTALAAERIVQ